MKAPKLSDIFNKETAFSATVTSLLACFAVPSVISFASHPSFMGFASAALTTAFTGYWANQWKRKATGRPFIDLD